MSNRNIYILNLICAMGTGFLLGIMIFIPFITDNYHISKGQAKSYYFTLPNDTIWRRVYLTGDSFKD